MADLPGALVSKAKAAIDEAFLDQVKQRFTILCGNEYPESLDQAVTQFNAGLADLRRAREKALEAIGKVYPT